MNGKYPVFFVKNEEADELLQYWKKHLFLEDWSIKLKLVDNEEELPIDNAVGTCNCEPTIKAAYIKILDRVTDFDDSNLKYCFELILVHELLHCKYMLVENSNKTYESTYLELVEHTLIEEMARTLVTVKYGLEKNWFFN